MRLLIRFICIVFILFAVQSMAQVPVFETFKVLKNRKDVNVTAIYQDNIGFMWFGTNYGLVKYDGITFELFTEENGLADNQITCITQDSNQVLWIGHKSGNITLYNEKQFSLFNPEEGLSKRPVANFFIDNKNVLWFTTQGEGVYYYTGKNRKRLYNINVDDGLLNNYAYQIVQDSSTSNYYISTDKGISVYNFDEKIFVQKITMTDGLPDNLVKDLFIQNNTLWIGMVDAGVCSYNLQTGTFNPLNDWEFGSLNNFVFESENTAWISTKRSGVIKVSFDKFNRGWYSQYKPVHGLASQKTNFVYGDSENNIWIGTNKGLSIRKNNSIEFLDAKLGISFSNVFSFTIDVLGNYWIASQEGLFTLSINEMGEIKETSLFSEDEYAFHSFISLYADNQGFVWAGTYGFGLYKINVHTLAFKHITENEGLANNNVIHINGDRASLWISTLGGGVSNYNYQNQHFKNFNHENGLLSDYVYSVFIDSKNNQWLCTDGGGIIQIVNDSLIPLKTVLTDSIAKTVYNAAEDGQGNLWFNVADRGLIKYTGDTMYHITELSGLKSNTLQSVMSDKYGNIVLSSNEGIEIYNIENQKFEYYGEYEKVAYLEPNVSAIFKDSLGNIWIGTSLGMIKLLPHKTVSETSAPKLYITSKRLFFNEIDAHRSVFKHDENHLSFHYSGFWFKSPESLVYRYKLEGYDIDWSKETRDREVTYSNLPDGKFTFLVQTKNQNGKWIQSQNSVYEFKIKPPYWKTLWFIIPMGIILLFLIYLFIKIRTYKLQKDKELLEEEVQKRTAEIQKQKEEIEAQRDEIEAQRNFVTEQRDKIEEQNKDITASIMYASRIQRAVLPPLENFENLLGEHFVFFKPRDIVSGDFYYLNSKNNQIVVAAADCTGHGVPGAFMSILSISLLNQIIGAFEGYFDAATILNRLRDEIKKSLRQTGVNDIAKDGLDISLCVIDKSKSVLQYSGAFNPLLLVRNTEAIVIKADKMPIGIHIKEDDSFTNNRVELELGDMLFMYSDGFQDQFGGSKGRKFLAKHLRELLVQNSNLKARKQHELLDDSFVKWKGKEHQIDDVLVLGIRV